MTYAIKRNGELVKEIVFIGDAANNLYRPHDVVIMTFETEKSAKQICDVWENAEVVKISA